MIFISLRIAFFIKIIPGCDLLQSKVILSELDGHELIRFIKNYQLHQHDYFLQKKLYSWLNFVYDI